MAEYFALHFVTKIYIRGPFTMTLFNIRISLFILSLFFSFPILSETFGPDQGEWVKLSLFFKEGQYWLNLRESKAYIYIGDVHHPLTFLTLGQYTSSDFKDPKKYYEIELDTRFKEKSNQILFSNKTLIPSDVFLYQFEDDLIVAKNKEGECFFFFGDPEYHNIHLKKDPTQHIISQSVSLFYKLKVCPFRSQPKFSYEPLSEGVPEFKTPPPQLLSNGAEPRNYFRPEFVEPNWLKAEREIITSLISESKFTAAIDKFTMLVAHHSAYLMTVISSGNNGPSRTLWYWFSDIMGSLDEKNQIYYRNQQKTRIEKLLQEIIEFSIAERMSALEYHLYEFIWTDAETEVVKLLLDYYTEQMNAEAIRRLTFQISYFHQRNKTKTDDLLLKLCKSRLALLTNNESSFRTEKDAYSKNISVSQDQKILLLETQKKISSDTLARDIVKNSTAKAWFYSNPAIASDGVGVVLLIWNEAFAKFNFYLIKLDENTGALDWYVSLGSSSYPLLTSTLVNKGEYFYVLTHQGSIFVCSPAPRNTKHPSFNITEIFQYISLESAGIDYLYYLPRAMKNDQGPRIFWNEHEMTFNPYDATTLFILKNGSLNIRKNEYTMSSKPFVRPQPLLLSYDTLFNFFEESEFLTKLPNSETIKAHLISYYYDENPVIRMNQEVRKLANLPDHEAEHERIKVIFSTFVKAYLVYFVENQKMLASELIQQDSKLHADFLTTYAPYFVSLIEQVNDILDEDELTKLYQTHRHCRLFIELRFIISKFYTDLVTFISVNCINRSCEMEKKIVVFITQLFSVALKGSDEVYEDKLYETIDPELYNAEKQLITRLLEIKKIWDEKKIPEVFKYEGEKKNAQYYMLTSEPFSSDKDLYNKIQSRNVALQIHYFSPYIMDYALAPFSINSAIIGKISSLEDPRLFSLRYSVKEGEGNVNPFFGRAVLGVDRLILKGALFLSKDEKYAVIGAVLEPDQNTIIGEFKMVSQ